MSGRQVGVIYFYLVSAASLALIVIGVFSLVTLAIDLTQYDKYPLQYQEDCAFYSGRPVKVPEEEFTEEEKQEQKALCEERVLQQRKKNRN